MLSLRREMESFFLRRWGEGRGVGSSVVGVVSSEAVFETMMLLLLSVVMIEGVGSSDIDGVEEGCRWSFVGEGVASAEAEEVVEADESRG